MSQDARDRELERERHRAELRAVREALAPGESPADLDPEPDRAADAPPDPLELELHTLAARTHALEAELRRAVIAGVLGGVAALALGGLALVLALLVVAAPDSLPASATFEDITVGRLAVRGRLEIVDEAGRRLALLGREESALGSSAPVTLGLYDGADGQAVRIAASPGGAALSLSAPGGSRSVSMVAFPTSAQVDVRDGARATALLAEGTRSSTAESDASPTR